MRVGFGYDVHPFVPGRPLILGGIGIPYLLGLRDIRMRMFSLMPFAMPCSGLLRREISEDIFRTRTPSTAILRA